MESIMVVRDKAIQAAEPLGYVPVNYYLKIVCEDDPETCFLISRSGRVFKVSHSTLTEARLRGNIMNETL